MLNQLSSIDPIETHSNAQTFGMQAEQGFDPHEAISFVWRQWKFISLITTIGLVVGAVVILNQTPYYTATAFVLLEPQKQIVLGTEQAASELNETIVENQAAIIRSSAFLSHVVERTKLTADPEFGSKGRQNSPDANASANNDSVPSNKSSPSDQVMASVGALQRAMTVTRVGLGTIFSISIASVSPERAAKLANAVANGYIVEKLDARFDAAKSASQWLGDRLVELRKQLRQSEEAVAQFRAEHGLVQSGSNVTLNQQQLSELNAKLVEARNDMAQKKARVDLLRSIKENGGNIQSLPDLPSSSTLQTLRQQDAAASQKEADLVARYSNNHPLVVNIRAERRDLQRAIATEVGHLAANIQNEYELAKSRVDALERSLKSATGQTGADDKTAITLRELERTAAVNKSLFENFLQKAKIAQEQSTFDARDARVITPAEPPEAPSHPRKLREMVISLVLGLLLGIGGALGKEKLMSGFVTPRQVEEILGIPLLASINWMTKSDLKVDGKATELPLFPAAMPLSRFSEAMRMLRSGVLMTDVDDPPKVIQITSSVPSEGKTTVALALAVSAAKSGLNTLFIDADLRHPSATRFLGLDKQAGLVDVLAGRCEIRNAMTFIKDKNLWALPAGEKTQNPTDMLASERMRTLITVSKQTFDMIVIDTAPVGPVIDPVIISNTVDKVVFVVRWAATSRELVQQSVHRFSGHRKVAGVVFNQVNEKLARKYGKHANAYYHGGEEYKKYYRG